MSFSRQNLGNRLLPLSGSSYAEPTAGRVGKPVDKASLPNVESDSGNPQECKALVLYRPNSGKGSFEKLRRDSEEQLGKKQATGNHSSGIKATSADRNAVEATVINGLIPDIEGMIINHLGKDVADFSLVSRSAHNASGPKLASEKLTDSVQKMSFVQSESGSLDIDQIEEARKNVSKLLAVVTSKEDGLNIQSLTYPMRARPLAAVAEKIDELFFSDDKRQVADAVLKEIASIPDRVKRDYMDQDLAHLAHAGKVCNRIVREARSDNPTSVQDFKDTLAYPNVETEEGMDLMGNYLSALAYALPRMDPDLHTDAIAAWKEGAARLPEEGWFSGIRDLDIALSSANPVEAVEDFLRKMNAMPR